MKLLAAEQRGIIGMIFTRRKRRGIDANDPFYVVKQGAGDLFFNNLSLHDKSEEDVSSAGEQLTSNKIYDGENAREGLSKRRVFSFSCFHCPNGLQKLNFLRLSILSMNENL